MMLLEFDEEEDRQLLLVALEQITVPWTMKDAPQKFATQQRVVRIHQAIHDAPLSEDPGAPSRELRTLRSMLGEEEVTA